MWLKHDLSRAGKCGFYCGDCTIPIYAKFKEQQAIKVNAAHFPLLGALQ